MSERLVLRRTLSAGSRGFTLIEMMLVLLGVAILTSFGAASYGAYVDRAKVARTTNDIATMQQAIERYYTQNWALPATLAAINYDTLLDPWGRTYYYQPFVTAADFKKARKDKKLHPLNSDFDLYSAGKDGKTVLPLTAKESQDDVLRANNGGFIGLGKDY